jgi:hypothetical protein
MHICAVREPVRKEAFPATNKTITDHPFAQDIKIFCTPRREQSVPRRLAKRSGLKKAKIGDIVAPRNETYWFRLLR